MKYRFINEHSSQHAVSLMCRVLRVAEVLVHSDQGSQYGSDDFKRFCQVHGLVPSMGRRGNCWDHAVMESFFSSLKKERIRKQIYKIRVWPGPMCLTTLKCSTTNHVATAIWAISVPRRLNAPGREAGICLLQRGQSNSD